MVGKHHVDGLLGEHRDQLIQGFGTKRTDSIAGIAQAADHGFCLIDQIGNEHQTEGGFLSSGHASGEVVAVGLWERYNIRRLR